MGSPGGIGGGLTNPIPPDENLFRETLKETNNTRIQTGSGQQGVILTKYLEDIPLEYAFTIRNAQYESSRPTLAPLFKAYYLDRPDIEDLATAYYLQIRNNEWDPALIALLGRDEANPDFDTRDPDLVAQDFALQFFAALQVWLDRMSAPREVTEDMQAYINLPEELNTGLHVFGNWIESSLDSYLSQIGPNDPDYDAFLNAANLIKQALHAPS